MDEQILFIAERIKGLREISGTSAETLAKELELPVELLLQYESGNSDIPIGFLTKVAGKFGVELSALLSGENPRLHVYCVIRKDKGLGIERRKQYKHESLAYNFANKKAEPFMVTIEPRPDDTPMDFNYHTGQEFNYILEGTMKIIIGDHEVILNEGDSIYYDSGYRHAMKALNNKAVKMLAVVI